MNTAAVISLVLCLPVLCGLAAGTWFAASAERQRRYNDRRERAYARLARLQERQARRREEEAALLAEEERVRALIRQHAHLASVESLLTPQKKARTH